MKLAKMKLAKIHVAKTQVNYHSSPASKLLLRFRLQLDLETMNMK